MIMPQIGRPTSMALLLAVLPVTLFEARAVAQESGALYVGGNYGYTLSTYSHGALNGAVADGFTEAGYALTFAATFLHDKEAPWSANIGYMISPYFGIEASYLDLRTLRYFARGTATSLFFSGPVSTNFNITSRGPTLALVAALPMTNDWYLNARAGAYESRTTTDYRSDFDANVNSGSEAESSTDLLAGAGTAYTLGSHWIVRLDYLYLDHIGEKAIGKSFNVNLLTAGVSYTF